MDPLVGYIRAHLGELARDLTPGLRESDRRLAEPSPPALEAAIRDGLWRFTLYYDSREIHHLHATVGAIGGLWSGEPGHLAIFIRVLFAFEDLLAIRARADFDDPEEFVDALRALRAAIREALCAIADGVVARPPLEGASIAPRRSTGLLSSEPGGASARTEGATAVPAPSTTEAPGGRRAGDVATRASLLDRLDQARPVAREVELRMLWSRLRAVATGETPTHQVVGVQAADGLGKSTLINSFIDRVEQHLNQHPVTLRTRAPRLFDLPGWPFGLLIREAFAAPPGVGGNLERVRSGVAELAAWRQESDPSAAAALLGDLPALLKLLGEREPLDPLVTLDPRTLGARTRAAAARLIEALALRARVSTGAPLFLIVEDAGELDGLSWELLRHVLHEVPSGAGLLLLLTYDDRFQVPAGIARIPGFSEVPLKPLDMRQGEQLIDALLTPNELDEGTRIRLTVGTQLSPLLLSEAIRQLVANGVISMRGGRWVECEALPESGLGDLAAIVARRCERLDATAAEVLQVVAVVEDTATGPVLSEVAGRRAIGRDELLVSLETLRRAGLVEVTVDEHGVGARIRHALIRDAVYRQMDAERRQAIHEDAAEVFLKLPGAEAFPTLAASHLAFAGWPTRALHGFLAGIDRCLRQDGLDGALELCSKALGQLQQLDRDERDTFLFRILLRREQVHTRLGHTEQREADLRKLVELAPVVGTEAERSSLDVRRARLAVQSGRGAEAEPALRAAWDRSREPGLGIALAAASWQAGRFADALSALDQVDATLERAGGRPAIAARAQHLRALILAAEDRLDEALVHAFSAWKLARGYGDPLGEGLAAESIAGIFWARGRLLDAQRLLRVAIDRLEQLHSAPARLLAMTRLGELLVQLGDFDEADQLFSEVSRTADRQSVRSLHARAVIGHGRLLVHRGRTDEAMSVLAQCLKELGRKAIREPVYVDALVALATNFALYARGEKLVVGGLRYAGEAADRAMEHGYLRGLIQALTVQVRGLVLLGRAPEAKSRLADVDRAMESGLRRTPHLARLSTEVELARYQVARALGDEAQATAARQAAWDELQRQLRGLRGSGYERGFLSNILHHREIVAASGERVAAEISG